MDPSNLDPKEDRRGEDALKSSYLPHMDRVAAPLFTLRRCGLVGVSVQDNDTRIWIVVKGDTVQAQLDRAVPGLERRLVLSGIKPQDVRETINAGGSHALQGGFLNEVLPGLIRPLDQKVAGMVHQEIAAWKSTGRDLSSMLVSGTTPLTIAWTIELPRLKCVAPPVVPVLGPKLGKARIDISIGGGVLTTVVHPCDAKLKPKMLREPLTKLFSPFGNGTVLARAEALATAILQTLGSSLMD